MRALVWVLFRVLALFGLREQKVAGVVDVRCYCCLKFMISYSAPFLVTCSPWHIKFFAL